MEPAVYGCEDNKIISNIVMFRLKTLTILGSKADLASLPEGKLLINTINAHSFNTAKKDLLFAEALTNGDVLHHQNNFCGLGTIGGGVRGASFATPQLGVRAHIQHLLAYTQTKRPSTDIVDPRYDLAHNIRLERGVVNTWYGLNGTWAMGSLYCEKIMATYQKILAQQPVEPEIKPAPAEPVKEKNKKKRSMKQRVSEILQEKK